MRNSKNAKTTWPQLILYLSLLTVTPSLSFADESKSMNNISALNEDSHLQKLIQSDQNLKVIYSGCVQAPDLSDCLWKGIQGKNADLEKKVKAAAEKDRKAVAQASQTSPSRAPASSSDGDGKKDELKIVAKDNTVKIDTAKDPFIIKLQENIEKQLDAVFTTKTNAVYKDSKGQVIEQAASRTFLATDHSKFASLYNTHLSNSIVQSMSSFCSEAKYDSNESKFYLEKDPDKRKQTLKDNIDLLKTAKLSPPSPEYKKYCVDFKSSKDQNEVAQGQANCPQYDPCGSSNSDKTSCQFNGCIGAVSKLCYDSSNNIPSSVKNSDDKKYTETRACEVMEFVKSARATIMALDNQENFYKEYTDKNPVLGIQLEGIKHFQSEGDVSRNSQDIVTITSKLAKDADEASKNELANINCASENNGQAIINNAEACKKLVIENKENAEKAVLELSLRRQVQTEEINEMTTVEQLKKFLMAEGDSEESADAYIEKITQEIQNDPGKTLVDELKSRISDKYKAETKAIIQGLADKVKDNSVNENDSASSKAKKYLEIQKELQAKGERYTNILHYSNIVSSYLTLTDSKTKKSSGNANQLYRELASRKDLADTKQIEENAQKAGLTVSKEDTSATTLDIKTINNEILKKNEK